MGPGTEQNHTNLRHGILLLLLACVGCQTNNARKPKALRSTVVRLVGAARYADPELKTWHALEEGDLLPSGCWLQTGKHSHIAVSLGQTLIPAGLYNPEVYPANLISLSGNSVLRIKNVTKQRGFGKTAEQIKLSLRRGRLVGNVKKLTRESCYEIGTTNLIATMQDTVYVIRETGELVVFKGSVRISLLDKTGGKEVAAGRQFDPSTGLITEVSSHLARDWEHDLWLPSDPAYIPWSEPRPVELPSGIAPRRAF